MKHLGKVSDIIQKFCNMAAICIMGAMSVIYFISILSRYFIGSGWSGSEEFTRYGMIWLIYISAVLITRDSGHLNVSVLETALKGRPRKILILIQRILMIAFLGIMTYVGTIMVGIGQRQTSPNMNIPMNYVYSVFPITFVLMVIQAAFISIRDWIASEDQSPA